MAERDTLGAVLRRLRHDCGLERAEVADAAGISEEYVGQLERNIKKPSIETLWALAKAVQADARAMAQVFALSGYELFWQEFGDAVTATREGVPSIDTFVDNTPELKSPEDRVTARRLLHALRDQAPPEPATEAEMVRKMVEDAG